MRFFVSLFNKESFSLKIWLVVIFSVSLMSCSSNDEEEDQSKVVAELVDIKSKFKPDVLWHTSVGNGVSDYFSRIKPVVAGNKVYSASREGDVVAIDEKTGKRLWNVDLSDVNSERSFWSGKESALLAGGPVVDNGKLFIGSENGKLYALNAENGDLLWQSQIKGEIITAPAVDLGILVVNTASGIMKALDTETGEEIWKVEQDVPPLTLRGVSQPVMASGGVLIGTSKGTVGVYILEKGQQGWVADIGVPSGSTELERVIDVDSAPLIFGDKVYAVSSRGNLAAIELKSGRIAWKRQYSSYRQITINRNSIYLTDVRGHVYSIDRLNGLERWSNLALTNRNVTGPAFVNGYIVVGDFDGYLHWLDHNTGEIVARHKVDGSGVYATPTVKGDVLYTQSRDGDIEAIATPKLVETHK